MHGELLAKRYLLAETLGTGGMGTVYHATDLRTGGSVAVKLIHPQFAGDVEYTARLRREAAMAASLTSPRVVRVTDLDEHAGAPFLVMEYVPGPTLQDHVQKLGRLPVPEALAIGLEVGRALVAAHAGGIVHGDLKPHNIKLVDGQVKVLDFGIARTTGTPAATVSGVYFGTPEYSAPEQAHGGGDLRADIYALGVILFQLVAGHLPFHGRTPSAILRAHATTPVPALGRHVPRRVQKLIARCLAKAPAARYQTAAELVQALDEALAGGRARSVGAEWVAPDDAPMSSLGTVELPVAAAPPTNLSAPLTSFIGRSWDMAELRRLLTTTRLLTLYGAGGCGKTRLAMEFARTVLGDYPDGVWLVELAGVPDGALVPHAIAATLKIRESAGDSLLTTLTAQLAQRQTLLILDNCEHLVAACATVADQLLGACPGLRILATSREALNITPETAWRVPSLASPHPTLLPSLQRLVEFEAVRLFTDRAAAVAPDFTVTGDNATAVATICDQLDGIPLALELAAARMRVLPVDQIAARLNDRFGFLVGGSRTAVGRHQTLRGAVDWSYDLLPAIEQQLFNRLAVFAGGFTVDAVEAVCSDPTAAQDQLELLTRLVDKSLVVPGDEVRPGRYQLLETLRRYAWERLTSVGEAESTQQAHAAYYLAQAERAESALTGPDSGAWLDQLDQDSDNIRVALRGALERGEAEAGLRLGSALWRYWSMRGQLSEGRAILAALLALETAPTDAPGGAGPVRAKALQSAGTLASQQGDYADAWELYQQALTVRRSLGDQPGIASTLNNLGIVARNLGDYAAARVLYEESLAIRQHQGDRWGMSNSLNNLGNVALDQGEYVSARQLHQGSLALRRELGDSWGVANSLNNLGNVASAVGDYQDARRYYLESMALARELADKWAIAYVLEDLGALAAAEAQPHRALRLTAAAGALRDTIGAVVSAPERKRLERRLELARASLTEAEQVRASAEGRALLLDDAIQYAIVADRLS